MRRICEDWAKRVGRRFSVDIVRKPRALLGRADAELHVDLDLLAGDVSRRVKRPFFVQVGANDGQLTEPFLHIAIEHGWRGILVEPQAGAFRRLQQRVKDVPGIVCRNVAIDHHRGERVLYRVRDDAGVPRWALGAASFSRSHLLSHRRLIPDIDRFIVEENVQCVTFADLMADAGDPRLDVLQIDAEGYDLEILKLADLPRRLPLLVNFEHSSLVPADWDYAVTLLLDLGYRVTKTGPDTLAYRPASASPSLCDPAQAESVDALSPRPDPFHAGAVRA